MLHPCELMAKQFLPAIRARVAKELSKKYNFNQIEIAKQLGVTQAAISKYISGDYAKNIKNFEKNKKVKEISDEIALKISQKKMTRDELISKICHSCEVILGDHDCNFGLIFAKMMK